MRTQLDQLELFCRRTGKEPKDLLTLARRSPQRLQDLVPDYVRQRQDEGRSSRYALNTS